MTEQEFESILRQALCPEIDANDTVVHGRHPGKEQKMNMKRWMKNTALIAAVIALLTITAYATDFLNIKTLTSGTEWFSSESYQEMERVMKTAGFQMDVKERFENGYAFDSVSVDDTDGLDENGNRVLSYREIMVIYRNDSGKRLFLNAHLDQEEIPRTQRPVTQSRTVGGITVNYYLDHYKFVPEDYELTDADRTWMEQPGNFLSYGSDEVEQRDVAFLCWEKEDICYMLMDSGARETPETLFSMAEELIRG